MEPMEMVSTGRVCYLHCNFCNTMLAVSVPYSSRMVTIATVRCGHCGNLLSVNMGALLLQTHVDHLLLQQMGSNNNNNNESSSSKCNSKDDESTSQIIEPPPRMPPIPPPEKRQRVPSAYNRFIKAEIQRIKASKPEISHREAFSAAAKNWAHFPNIQFELKLAKRDHSKGVVAESHQIIHRSNGFY
ncbi:putative axial regulator YABBY 2 isoform X2 [Impatiens glandulifera]|uniref:putative axial regulator YABBY 2 isoform X2 n=1 Tax=Impatiens glandulifera TaxID=253017 RepID=UPI001FB13D3A|nr:putative axial regulator YABBY 2 isoform X2 [Impatiens glandulifera]